MITTPSKHAWTLYFRFWMFAATFVWILNWNVTSLLHYFKIYIYDLISMKFATALGFSYFELKNVFEVLLGLSTGRQRCKEHQGSGFDSHWEHMLMRRVKSLGLSVDHYCKMPKQTCVHQYHIFLFHHINNVFGLTLTHLIDVRAIDLGENICQKWKCTCEIV